MHTEEYMLRNRKLFRLRFFMLHMTLKMEQLISLGITIMIVGFIIVFFGVLLGSKETSSKTKVAVGGFIGPIPFGFGNDKNLVWFVAILSLVFFLVWLFFSLRIWK